jgi:hypothetical protein
VLSEILAQPEVRRRKPSECKSGCRHGWFVDGWRLVVDQLPPRVYVARGADQPNRPASRERERDAVGHSYLAVAMRDILHALPQRRRARGGGLGCRAGCPDDRRLGPHVGYSRQTAPDDCLVPFEALRSDPHPDPEHELVGFHLDHRDHLARATISPWSTKSFAMRPANFASGSNRLLPIRDAGRQLHLMMPPP